MRLHDPGVVQAVRITCQQYILYSSIRLCLLGSKNVRRVLLWWHLHLDLRSFGSRGALAFVLPTAMAVIVDVSSFPAEVHRDVSTKERHDFRLVHG